jgi:hypothetical protein
VAVTLPQPIEIETAISPSSTEQDEIENQARMRSSLAGVVGLIVAAGAGEISDFRADAFR